MFPGRYFWIIIVLAAAWQIVGSLIQRANRKQREERLRELATQREAQLPSRAGVPMLPSPGLADDLAARRRAQIEELRQRRAGRQQPQQRPGLHIGAGPPTLQRTPPRGPVIARQPRPAQPAGRPMPTLRPPPQSRPKAPPVISRPRPVPPPAMEAPPPPVEEVVETVVMAPSRPAPAAAKKQPEPGAARLSRLSRRDLTPQTLRSLIVLREILDPPVSEREHEVWQRM